MGLDMYLTKRTYIGANYEHRNIAGEINLTKDGNPIPINPKRISEIIEHIGYWRKANHIHKWFVDNVQEGTDDCGDYWVSKENLEKLLAECKKVVEKPVVAAAVLPTQSGFFFGSTDYDEYYLSDIEDTIKIVEQAIMEAETGDIYYHSSW
jgi:hypothetical protein